MHHDHGYDIGYDIGQIHQSYDGQMDGHIGWKRNTDADGDQG